MQTKKQEREDAYSPPACQFLVDSEEGCGSEAEVDVNVGICPYFKRDRGNGRVTCEGASFRFPDKLARREYLYRFCAHPSGYKTCPLKVALDHHYERKYDYHA